MVLNDLFSEYIAQAAGFLENELYICMRVVSFCTFFIRFSQHELFLEFDLFH
jgi:hypothetical protein